VIWGEREAKGVVVAWLGESDSKAVGVSEGVTDWDGIEVLVGVTLGVAVDVPPEGVSVPNPLVGDTERVLSVLDEWLWEGEPERVLN
jgi:hypothetical protein